MSEQDRKRAEEVYLKAFRAGDMIAGTEIIAVALRRAEARGIEKMRDAAIKGPRYRMKRGRGPGEFEPIGDPQSNWILLPDLLDVAARLLAEGGKP